MNETERWAAPHDPTEVLAEELERIDDKLDRLVAAVGLLDRRRDDTEQLLADLMPAANGAMRVATRQLWELERKGTIALFKDTVAALEEASGRIDPADVQALGESGGRAMRTLRILTGPDVAVAAERSVEALQEARTGKPPGFFALLRRLWSPRARRGLGALLGILEGLGEGAHPVTPGTAARRTPRPARTAPTPAPAAGTQPRAGMAPLRAVGPSTLQVGERSIALSQDGFLVDPDDWSPEVAEAMAEEEGIGPLTDEHWRVLEFCRSDSAGGGSAPGLRRVTKELGIPPKDMYRLFPRGPGTLAARLAGLGKPKSCV